MKVKLLLFFVFFFVWISTSQAILFDRRPAKSSSLSYFIFPIAGSVPGVQTFYGITAQSQSIAKTNMGASFYLLQGDANEHFAKQGDSRQFQGSFFDLANIPVLFSRKTEKWTDHLTLSLTTGEFQNFAIAARERGIASNQEPSGYILLKKNNFLNAELSLQLFENQLEFHYIFSDGETELLGIIDSAGDFMPTENRKISNSVGGEERWGIYLDDTDNRRDPRIGYRVQYERYNYSSTQKEAPTYHQNDYNITGYIPLTKNKNSVLVFNQFYSEAIVTEEGTVNPNDYDCMEINSRLQPDVQLNCEDDDVTASLEARETDAKKEAKIGSATALGGLDRLRGYPQSRFSDSYTNFQGIEFRYYFLETKKTFDWIVEKGVYTGMQLAAFYEQGTVAPNTGELWKNIKNSYGFGARVVLSSFIFRMDLGFSEEGREVTVFFDYPF